MLTVSTFTEFLKPLIDGASSNLPELQCHQLSDTITRYSDVIMGPNTPLRRTDFVKHLINTGDAKPIKLSSRRKTLRRSRDLLYAESGQACHHGLL